MIKCVKLGAIVLTTTAMIAAPALAEDGASPDYKKIAAVKIGKDISPAIAPLNKLKSSPSSMNMVTINPGRFKMGSPRGEEQRDAFEGPVQNVSIGYFFEVGKYEVTFDEYDACVRAGACTKTKDGDWGRGKRPVINVSWNDTQKYLTWLNKKTGKNYRLLSEAEWEYIARAGSDKPFYTGGAISTRQANFNGEYSYGGSSKGKYTRKTVPVGSYAANPFGLHDVHGNVFEWTQDCWNESHNGAPNDGSARESGDCKFRVMRGGSWVNLPYQIRAAKRVRYTTDYRYDDYGFRIARTLSD